MLNRSSQNSIENRQTMTALLEKDFSPYECSPKYYGNLAQGKGNTIYYPCRYCHFITGWFRGILHSTSNLSREGVIWKIDPKGTMSVFGNLMIRLRHSFAKTNLCKWGYASRRPEKNTNEFLRAYGLYHGINIYFVVWILVIYAFGVRKTLTCTWKKNIKPTWTLFYPSLTLSSQYGLTSREQEVVRLEV